MQRTIKFSEPIEFAGQTYTQITLKKLKVKHMLDVDWDSAKTPIAQFASLAAACSGVDVGVIYEMDMDDFAKVQAVIEDFFPQGQRTQST